MPVGTLGLGNKFVFDMVLYIYLRVHMMRDEILFAHSEMSDACGSTRYGVIFLITHPEGAYYLSML